MPLPNISNTSHPGRDTRLETSSAAVADPGPAPGGKPGDGGDYACLRGLRHACQLIGDAAASAIDPAQPLRHMLAAGAGELTCGGRRYAVAVHVDRHDVWVSARRADLPRNRLIRFIQAVADLFRRRSFRTRAKAIERMLTGVARSPAVAAQGIVPAPQARAARCDEVRRARQKQRAAQAIRQIRGTTRARQREKGISGNLARDFPKVDLSRIGPAGMDWSGIDLSCLDLSRTCLKNFNLAGADLSGSLLYYTDLSGADLSHARLSGARTRDTKLVGANLIGAILGGMRIERVDFRHANCAGVDFSTAMLANLGCGTDFRDGCFVGANFSQTHLMDPDFSRADLTRANLRATHLTGAIFDGARLAGACLDGSYLELRPFAGADFRGASLGGVYVERGDWLKSAADAGATDIRLHRSELQIADLQERLLNHRANATSLQRNIDAIADDSLKLELMRQLFVALCCARNAPLFHDAPGLRDVRLSLLDVLAGNPLYAREDEAIAAWVAACCDREVARYNTRLLVEPLPDAVLVRLMEAALARLGTPDGASDSGLGVMQLVFRTRAASLDPAATEMAERLAQAWLRTLPDSLRETVAETSEIACESLFPLVCKETGSGLLMSEDYFANRFLQTRLKGEFPDVKWEMLWAVRRNDTEPATHVASQVVDIRAALSPFPLLAGIYQRRDCAAARPAMLRAMGLEPFGGLFLAAMAASGSKDKLIRPADQQRLVDCLAPHIEGRWVAGRVSDRHVAALTAVYPELPVHDDARGTAYFLLCLSAMMAKLSSSKYFGDELESPLPLRGYAGALLNKARALAPDLVGREIADDWTNRLFGLHKAFDCTAILSAMMLHHLSGMARADPKLDTIHESLLPAAWR